MTKKKRPSLLELDPNWASRWVSVISEPSDEAAALAFNPWDHIDAMIRRFDEQQAAKKAARKGRERRRDLKRAYSGI